MNMFLIAKYFSISIQTFSGVKGRYQSVQVDLPIAVVAKCLRLQVETKSSNSINPGLRWEILGCNTGIQTSCHHIDQIVDIDG